MTNEERLKKFKSGNIAVNCSTQEEAKEFAKWCYKNNIKWFNKKIEETNFEVYLSNTCYRYFLNSSVFSSKQYYESKGINVVSYQCFMKGENNMKNENKITNLEWILENVDKKIIHDVRICSVIYEHVQKNSCDNTKCYECKFRDNNDVLKFLNEKHGNKIKLTKFEYDLLEMVKNSFGNNISFSTTICYDMQYKKGYFKNVDSDMTLKEILENCEVVE